MGGEGADREAELAAEIDRHGMVAVGPHSVGVMNADPAVRLNASFISTIPKAGEHKKLHAGFWGQALIRARLGIGMKWQALALEPLKIGEFFDPSDRKGGF